MPFLLRPSTGYQPVLSTHGENGFTVKPWGLRNSTLLPFPRAMSGPSPDPFRAWRAVEPLSHPFVCI